ncbi:peptidyl-prolyl cis-trans isomerase [Solidesulfovibrio sp.]
MACPDTLRFAAAAAGHPPDGPAGAGGGGNAGLAKTARTGPSADMELRTFHPVLARLVREPLVHFICIGAALFGLNAFLTPPLPPPTASRIVITEDDARQLSGLFAVQWNRAPTPDELRRLVEEQVREEVLIREALAAGLERQDILVRRRLAALAASRAGDGAAAQPSEDALRAFFEPARERFAVPAELTMRQIYFSDRTRSGRAKEEAIQARDALTGRGAADPGIGTAGDPAEFPDRLEAQTPEEVAALFGQPFAAAVTRLPVGSWQGPVPSQGGWHLVFIEAATPGPLPALESVREAVILAWQQERRDQEQRQAFAAMRAGYVVELPASLGAGGGP